MCHPEPEPSLYSCPKVLLSSVSPGVCSPALLPRLAWPPCSCRDMSRAGRPWQGPREAPTARREQGRTGNTGCPSAQLRHSWTCIPLLRAQHGGRRQGLLRTGRQGGPGRDTLQQWHREGRVDESCSGAGCRCSSTGKQPMGLWLTQWSTDELHPAQPLPTLNSNIVSILQIPSGIFPGKIFSWSQTSAAL